MPRKRKRRNAVVEIGNGPAKVRIYTINRKDGYDQFTLAWNEEGRRKTRCFSCMDEAKMVGQQITVRLINGGTESCEATRRDIDMLRHCERTASEFGVTLAAAIEEWASARKTAGEVALSDAVRFYAANRADLVAIRSIAQVADEFVASRQSTGVSDAYIRSARLNLKKFTDRVRGNITDISTSDINRFLGGLEGLGPVSRNTIRRNLITMFSFAKKQGYLHPDRKTAAELSESFKVPDTKIEIFTPDEMRRILLAANARILPLIAIGGFAGIRSAEILRLDWEDIKWGRGHIEIAGSKAKTAARRLVPLTDNLKAWLEPWRGEKGKIMSISDYAGALNDTAVKAKIPGGWRQNALRHSFISYRVAETGDVARTSLEAGNSPKQVFRSYREVVDAEATEAWWAIMPPEGWEPVGLSWSIRERLKHLSCRHDNRCVDTAVGA
ncbi:MAG: tyrosine-type recombinase/integrase [Luteolibacter sp.]